MQFQMENLTFNQRRRDREFVTQELRPPELQAFKGGGGGSSGEIIYPSYFETYLSSWLADIDSLITTAQSNNPFTSMAPYNPATRITTMETAVTNMNTLATYDPETEWDVFDGIANSAFTASMSSGYVDNVMDAYEDDAEVPHMNAVGRYAAQMSEINAVMTSSYLIGLGQLAQEFTRGLNRARYELEAEFERRRPVFILQACAQMSQLFAEQKQLGMHNFDAELDTQKAAIIALKEEADLDNQFDVDDALWDLELYKYGANLMAGPAGGAAGTRSQSSTTQSALGGALSGAALGFQAAGTPGAIFGGIGGLIAGII